MELTVGTIIDHDRYGKGVVAKVNFADYEIYFEHRGKVNIIKTNTDFTVVEKGEEVDDTPRLTLKEVETALRFILERHNGIEHKVELGDRWIGGKMILQPANTAQQSKEIPVETFFHKIVMLRDRLRVLEQNINSNSKLNDEDKVNLQQYITRIYGSLTTFNVLFKNKEDNFVGTGGSKD